MLMWGSVGGTAQHSGSEEQRCELPPSFIVLAAVIRLASFVAISPKVFYL
jgi:hypothetical protein